MHFGFRPFGKAHVRFDKGAKTSGPRPRWVPMLDGPHLILAWYLTEIAPRLGEGPALFCDEGGGRISRGTIRNRLAHLLDLEATASGEAGPGSAGLVRRDSCDVSQMRGHLHVGTTKRYVTPSTTLVDAANRRAVSGTLPDLGGAGDGVQPESTDGVRRSWA